ncbi:P1 family peptidase [Rubrimonas cliftonensis]|uniref:L-aminopeptidase/D-esterase n=1 Tax=Rubrimonas cliftonensis TaxID=89524 RepID=A0A1H3XGT7_9RHOB|nr:L-aminopeptidase/D-esterase [Rubrimonas cliftonensis]
MAALSGPRNALVDVPGLSVGHADEAGLRSGASVVLFHAPATAAVDVRGGAPGARETDLLALENTVERVDAIALSGGSVFGLEAAGGVVAGLRRMGRGFAVGAARAPIVPAAILFDLGNGGDKAWGLHGPYRELGLAALDAAGADARCGAFGAGFGAQAGQGTAAPLRGGLGTASALDAGSGATVGALVAVNALGSPLIGDGPHFWAAPFERGAEFAGLGWPARPDIAEGGVNGALGAATTIAVVATDAALSKPQCRRLAIMAQDGLARALRPAHTPFDGDAVFAASCGSVALETGGAEPTRALARLGALAADVLARAVARGVFEAASARGLDGLAPAWRDRFGAA